MPVPIAGMIGQLGGRRKPEGRRLNTEGTKVSRRPRRARTKLGEGERGRGGEKTQHGGHGGFTEITERWTELGEGEEETRRARRLSTCTSHGSLGGGDHRSRHSPLLTRVASATKGAAAVWALLERSHMPPRHSACVALHQNGQRVLRQALSVDLGELPTNGHRGRGKRPLSNPLPLGERHRGRNELHPRGKELLVGGL